MRKFFLLLLLLAGWAVIFWPVYSDDLAESGLFSDSHPSEKPLPPAWQQTEMVQLSSPADASSGGFPVTSSSMQGDCAGTYTLQAGDSLGKLALRCGLSLADLLAANPQIQKPSRIFTGERITIPAPQAGQGSGSDALAVEGDPSAAAGNVAPGINAASIFSAGDPVKVEAAGLPPNTPVRIGLGLSSHGYSVIAQSQTGADGRVSITVNLPADALPGDTAFIMVSTSATPSVQRMSETFTIR